MGLILSKLESAGFKIIKLKTAILDLETSKYLEESENLTSDVSLLLEVV